MTDANATVEQARQQVARIAAEIQRLAQSSMPSPEFFERFLPLLVKATGARAGVVWMLGPGGQLTPMSQVRLSELQVLDDPGAQEDNLNLLRDVFSTGQARCVGADQPQLSRFPVRSFVTLAPLQKGENCVGVVELFQKPDTAESARAGYLQFVEQLAGHASRFLTTDRHTAAAAGGVDPFWQELADFDLEMQGSLKPKHVASVAVNDGRLLLKCDRLTVITKKGRKLTVQAVSGQDTVHHRANLIRSMIRLTKKVLPSKQTFTFGESTKEPPPTVKEPLADFLAESGARRLVMVPLFEPEPVVQKKEAEREKEKAREKKQPFGCLVVEQLSQDEGAADLARRAEIVADHVAGSLGNARKHHQVFLLPLFSTLGGMRDWFHGRKLAKTLLILGCIASVVIAMIAVKWEYRVEATGRLMPAKRQAVFAPWEGTIDELFVEDGKDVKKGQKLLRLINNDIDLELSKTLDELNSQKTERHNILAQLDDNSAPRKNEDVLRLNGRLAEVNVRIKGLEKQVKVLKLREESLTVRAPISGVVTTFRIRELLYGRPVQRGEALLEVADPKGEWRLEVDVEEKRMGHLLRAQAEREAEKKGPLPVDFVIATAPTESYDGRLQTIATRPKRVPESGSLVEVYASIPKDPELKRRIGAEVRAKIRCGEKALGYVWFGDVIEFVQRRWWW